MNSTTITMERETALAKLEEYEQAIQKNPKALRDLDKQVMQGYRVLARGGRMIDVNAALKEGGLNLAKQPRLALSRADAEQVMWQGKYWNAPVGQSVYLWHNRGLGDQRYQSDRFQWMTPAGTFEPGLSDKRFVALTPLIPLPHRPKFALSNYFLLWEANWHKAPPTDPYLLRPVAGSLMEIVAEWDVSPLELAAVNAAMSRR